MSVGFSLTAARRRLVLRRNLSSACFGLFVFVASLIAFRIRGHSWLAILGAAGALLFVLGLRRAIVGSRPVRVGERAVWFGTRGIPFSDVVAVEVEGSQLTVLAGSRRFSEELAEPALAAAEIARRAGLRPPRRDGPKRWERGRGGEP